MGETFYETSRLWVGNFSLIVLQDSLFLIIIFALLFFFRNTSARIKYTISLIGIIKLIIPPFIPYTISGGSIGPIVNIPMLDNVVFQIPKSTVHPPENPHLLSINNTSWQEWIFIIWIMGAIISLLISFTRVLSIAYSLRGARRLEISINSDFVPSEKINIYQSDRIYMPVTVVFFPNRIFVPTAWNEWDDQCRKLVLKHEYIHLQHYDNLIQLVQVIAQAIFFFHPFVYILNKKVNLYREMVCDDKTIQIGESTSLDYSKCLTRIAEGAMWTPAFWQPTSAFINKKNDLSDRIKYQMKEEKMKEMSKKVRESFVILVLLLIPAFSWYLGTVEAEPMAMEEINEDIIQIRISNDEDVYINGKNVEIDDFKNTLSKIADRYDDPIVDLEFDENVRIPFVFQIQGILRSMELLKIRYADDGDRVLNLQLPNTASEEQLKKIAASDILTLNVISTGDVESNDIKVDIEKLEKFLRDHHAKNEYLIVSIKADNDVIYKDFIVVLDEVRKSQSKRVLIHETLDN